ncbi:hypothetical protein N0V90_003430 [Kalmusia sp. IMI 367209]|nr:hypothetical protein N0V90_003430 [Kalmusia sp. IMI 367209]
MSTKDIWVRHFKRDAGDDEDTPATDEFKKQNFTDYFGQFLQQGTNRTIDTFDKLVTVFWNQAQPPNATVTFDTYAIADGAFIDQKTVGSWFNPHLRFIAVIKPKDKIAKWRLYIVGPDQVKATDRFLQVASWDGQVFRFYAFDQIEVPCATKAWIYQGNSFDAFTDNSSYDTAYLGPFNGHVNGALIMKERKAPWYHWKSGENLGFLQCIPEETKTMLQSIPYLTAGNLPALSGASVRDAPPFQNLVEGAVTDWYSTRQSSDFVDPTSSGPNTSPHNVQSDDGSTYTADMNHFFNSELLLSGTDFGLMPDLSSFGFTFDISMYKAARARLRLSLLQEIGDDDPVPPNVPVVTLQKGTLGGGKQTAAENFSKFLVVSDKNEGVPFVILQTAFEDAQGVASLSSIGCLGDNFPNSLISDKAIRAIIMLDFWNPVYSWRRGVLMQYVPSHTTLTGNGVYDLEEKWVTAIKASSYTTQTDSPEYLFLQLYGSDNVSDYQQRITDYLTAVNTKLMDQEGLYDYLCLAESRRRIYRPLPLDEFGVQLPYALNLPVDWAKIEMQQDGTTTPIPSRGIEFFGLWTRSLASFNPRIIPANNETTAVIAESARGSRCPMMKLRTPKRGQVQARKAVASNQLQKSNMRLSQVPKDPTWNDDVSALFNAPYWVANPQEVGAGWIAVMKDYSPPCPQRLHLDLSNEISVRNNVLTIYQHLRSKSMPITSDPNEYWPEEALETLRLWANQGFRTKTTDPFRGLIVIPPPDDPPQTMRVRKDILSLTPDELRTYRERLDYVLQVGSLKDANGKQTKWQELGFLHAEWCLHYQEATFLWHRAYLRYVEELIDFPIPYWNGYATVTADVDSTYAGLPSIFLEDEYINSRGELRKNPLRWALGPNGANKLGNKYVERAAELVAGPGDPNLRPLWERKVKLFGKYHKQIASALAKESYSEPEDPTGFPWANLPAFSDDQPDSDYPDTAKQFFDGLFEQAHDNYHGWVGPDMADNTYTAFDPIFLSYHCNMDRIVDIYLSSHPRGRQFTSNFALQPFTKQATDLDYDDPRLWLYTTIGDMAKDTKALQYLYAPPLLPDYMSVSKVSPQLSPRGGKALAVHEKLTNLSTMDKENKKQGTSYEIDVFVAGAVSLDPDPTDNADFIGRVTRIGMGDGGDAVNGVRNVERCKKPAVSRVLDASDVKERLTNTGGVQIVVKELPGGRELSEEELKRLPGFKARVLWG